MTASRLFLIASCLAFLSSLAQAQDQHWNQISLNASVGEVDFNLDSEQRMENVFDNMSTFILAAGAETALGENNSVGVELLREDRRSGGRWAAENRYSLLLGDSRSLGDFKLGTRFKLESRDKPSGYELRARLRFKLSTTVNDWTPWASVELMYNNSQSYFSENRYSLGADYQLTPTLNIGGYYLYRRTTGGGDWNAANIIGTKFTYEF